jgi:hypothetical protein
MPAHLRPLDDGWHEWHDHTVPDGPAPGTSPSVRVRLGEGEDGRLHLVEMHVDAPGQLSAEVLRSIPVGRIEAAANAQLHASAPGPGAVLAAWPGEVAALDADSLRVPDELRIGGEPGRGYPDMFYGAVAAAYRLLAAASPRPVADLAGANEVPVTTAQRWVKEARRRGHLAPGRPGKAG